MANLAIKGHATKGDEVIEILGILGGSNAFGHIGNNPRAIYYIDETYKKFITCSETKKVCDCVIFTLEEFLEKFPYKVGDKVNYVKYNEGNLSVYTIQRMRWTGMTVEYLLDSNGFSALAKDLQPYKEEIVDTGCCSMPTTPPSYKLSVKQLEEMKQTIVFSNDFPDEIELVLGDNYEVKIKEGKTYVVKKKPKYPKTYEDCCKVLLLNPEKSTYSVCGLEYKRHLIVNFQRLIICRDAYWKIAGNWKPKYKEGVDNNYYTIHTFNNKITLSRTSHRNAILSFPTEETRNAFYENFKDLIEQCKKLL